MNSTIEIALAELIDKIVPGLDSGDILADARIASERLSVGPAVDALTTEPIYQTCFIKDQWRDVDRFEYERAKSLRSDLARIVYAHPASEPKALTLTDEQIRALRKASAVLCGTGHHDEASEINGLLADRGSEGGE
jgi:hypothetical protein